MRTAKIARKMIDALHKDASFADAVSGIRAGKFRRDARLRDYHGRLVYGRRLCEFLYDKAIMFAVLNDCDLKERLEPDGSIRSRKTQALNV